MAQTEMDGYGRVLYLTKDVWPSFISCVLAVNEDMIQTSRDEVQRLVDGIARSGKWLDQKWTTAWMPPSSSASNTITRIRDFSPSS